MEETNQALKRTEEDLFEKMIDKPREYYKRYRDFIVKYSLEYKKIKERENDNYRSLG